MILTAQAIEPAVAVGTSPITRVLPLAHAQRWRLTIRHAGDPGAADITALRVRRRPLEHPNAWGPWESITAGLPLSQGDSLSIRDDVDDCAESMEVEITASGGDTTVDLFLAGV